MAVNDQRVLDAHENVQSLNDEMSEIEGCNLACSSACSSASAQATEPAQTEAGTMASPCMSNLAVLNKAACVTFCPPGKCGAGSVCNATLNSPVGCSTDTFFALPLGMTATPSQTEPSNTQAVPTVTAAKTPMAS
jgi:hypothetical protein